MKYQYRPKLYNSIISCVFLFTAPLSCTAKNEPQKKNKVKQIYYGILETDPERNLDPKHFIDIYSVKVARQVYNRLLRYDEKLDIVSELADNFEISKDLKVYTFTLKKGVYFHDSHLLTTDDVIYTLTRLRQKNSTMFVAFKYIKNITKIDETKFKIELNKPYSLILDVLTSINCSIVQKNYFKKENSNNNKIIGTGPFALKEWIRGEKIILIRNDRYFDKQSKLDELVFLIESNLEKIKEILKTVTLHDLGRYGLYYKDILDKYEYSRVPIIEVNFLNINVNKKPFDNIKAREAFILGFDKVKYVKTFYKDSKIANGYVPYGLAGYNPTIPTSYYDPIKAKKLFTELNIKDVIQVIFDTPKTQMDYARAKMVENFYSDFNIMVKVKFIDEKEIISRFFRRDFQVIDFMNESEFPDAFFHLSFFLSDNKNNFTGLRDATLDNLINSAISAIDKNERYELYKKIDEAIMARFAVLPLFYFPQKQYFHKSVKGLNLTFFGSYTTRFEEVWIEND